MNPLQPCRPTAIGRTLAKVDRLGAPQVVAPPPGAVTDEPPPARRGRPSRRVLLIALVAIALVAVAVFALTRGPATPPLTTADVDKAVSQGLEKSREDAAKAPADATVAYQVVQPSLVRVGTSTATGTGTGAGVVINADGSVLTALHVVDGARSIEVTFSDGTRSAARVSEKDEATDIAVLAVDELPQVVVPAVMGGGPQVGDPVFALGHPLGLQGSLSAGVVSALDRNIQVASNRTLEGLIQFDAAVNPGNSGGPLLNKAGQVVGIVTGLANPSEQNFFVGIGFAVPIATAGGVAGGPAQ